MAVLLVKLLLAPALVVASSLAGRRWGPGVSGAIVAFPIVAGPILLVIQLEHGPDFTRDASVASLLGLASLAVFSVVFARLGRRLSWLPTLLAGWVAVLVVDVLAALRPTTALVALAAAVVAIALALRLMPRSTGAGADAPVRPPTWDLPARALATAALVVTLTTVSGVLGPQWTGVLATFPIATSVVAGFALAQNGPANAARMLGSTLVGLFGFAGFCFTVAALVHLIGLLAFAYGVVVAVAVQVAVTAVRRVAVSR
ncbi:hypothetical protein ACQEVB_06000 [Pseudonocardia sp. CA-107938]|uniref:hypothetical protein n=1 Tax=Pseudonocardia sp. CA-107938 TaxID=3240021 RepID=UPI003D8E762C